MVRGENMPLGTAETPVCPPGTSESIVNPASLTRDRQIDLCGLCHSGAGTPIVPSLTFLPGDVLDDYIDIPYASPEDVVDVHGSQVQLEEKPLLPIDHEADVHDLSRRAYHAARRSRIFVTLPGLSRA
jgi:hypothetical protein